MKKIFFTLLLLFGLTACDGFSGISIPSFSAFNPLNQGQPNNEQELIAPEPNPSAIETELSEIELLTGARPQFVNAAIVKTEKVETLEKVENVAVNSSSTLDLVEVPSLPVVQPQIVDEERVNAVDEKPIFSDEDLDISSAVGCPMIEIMPAARSVTYFEDNMYGRVKARAVIDEIRGGCEVIESGMELDLDILMQGTITSAGRFQGRQNEEAFMTFPYFISIYNPQGLPIDKKIMATAMRFEPSFDYIDHAEKITKFIPMENVKLAANHKIVVGYQLTRKQLEYNKVNISQAVDNKRKSPDSLPVLRRSANPLAK